MNYELIVSQIENKLKIKYPEVMNTLYGIIRAGSTGGEIISEIGYYLLSLEKINNEVFEIISDEIRVFLRAGNEEGIYFRYS
ncbi:MAG TPA: hypothetical protein VLZ83_05315 [Edaphocola sp.]|nr:hypothetical protein [Edaphocola sp.]